MTDYIINGNDLQSIANKIRAKGQTSGPIVFPGGFIDAVDDLPDAPVLESLSVTDNGEYTPGTGVDGFNRVTVNVSGGGGGGSVTANAVNFRDYNGTVVASYSAEDFAELVALPSNPDHTSEGLTAQGWNWSLSDAKTYVAKYGRLEIGQMYITTDGKTHVHIHLEQGRTSPMLGVCPNGTVDVDWGDGTAHDTLTGTSTTWVKWTSNHNYAAPGDYVIKLTVTGSMGFYGYSSINQYSGLLRYSSSGDARNIFYQSSILNVNIGDNVTSIGSGAFYSCYSLSSITIPDNVTSIGSEAFTTCYSLSSITIPDSVTSIDNNAFKNCYSLLSITIPDNLTTIGIYTFNNCIILSSITIPNNVTSISMNAFNNCFCLSNAIISDNVTSIGSGAFYSCRSLSCITIPDSVTSIDTSVFQYCTGVAEYHFKSTTPPTLANTNAFSSISADCIIYVPYSADHSILESYKTATNWSTYADRMQEEPQ